MTKKKLIISLCAFVLVVAVGVVGVLAATQQNATIRSIVSYTASDVSARVDFKLQRGPQNTVSGATETALTNNRQLLVDTATAGAETESPEFTGWTIVATDTTATRTQAVPDTEFLEINNYTILYTFTVTNNASVGGKSFTITPTATVGDLTVTSTSQTFGTFSDKQNGTAVLAAAAVSAEGVTIDGANVTLAPQATCVVTLTLTLTDARYEISARNVAFNLQLANVAA